MRKSGTPMLFLPPLPPSQLPAEGCFVVGRSRSCDLTLATPDASRRHAEIAAVTGGYLIRDLGSTNGTFIGKMRVREVFLAEGSRILVGRSQIEFSTLSQREEFPLSRYAPMQRGGPGC